MSRPTDHLQPSGKRRPGEQLTKDNAGDSDEEGPVSDLLRHSCLYVPATTPVHLPNAGILITKVVDPGTWGKADQATMARRKVVRARRGAVAEPVPQVQAANNEQAAGNNPFSGVSLTETPPAAANPFSGVSLLPNKVSSSIQTVLQLQLMLLGSCMAPTTCGVAVLNNRGC